MIARKSFVPVSYTSADHDEATCEMKHTFTAIERHADILAAAAARKMKIARRSKTLSTALKITLYAAGQVIDHDLCEELHSEGGPWSDDARAFYNEYKRRHEAKHGETFTY